MSHFIEVSLILFRGVGSAIVSGGPEQRPSCYATDGDLGQPVATQNLGFRLKGCVSNPKYDPQICQVGCGSEVRWSLRKKELEGES